MKTREVIVDNYSKILEYKSLMGLRHGENVNTHCGRSN